MTTGVIVTTFRGKKKNDTRCQDGLGKVNILPTHHPKRFNYFGRRGDREFGQPFVKKNGDGQEAGEK